MKYILINRENIVVDILSEVRYIKLHSGGFVVACAEKDGIGVIGSDSNTHYPLIAKDTTNDNNAVRVIEKEEVADNIVPNFYKLDSETGEIVYRYTLEEAQAMKQEKNKLMFAAYLATHPLIWVDGKEYGITLEDQSEISLNINQYQIAVQSGIAAPTLEWHAKHEACTPWSLENLAALSLAITQAVYPYYRQCQDCKLAIYAATSIEELDAIEITYGETAATE